LNLIKSGGGLSFDNVCISAANQSVTSRNYNTSPSVMNEVSLVSYISVNFILPSAY